MNGSSMLIATVAASSIFAGMLLSLMPRLVAPQLGLPAQRWRGGQAIILLTLVLMIVAAGVGIDKWGIRPVLLSGLLTALLALSFLKRCPTKTLAGMACTLFGAGSGAAVSATVFLFCRVLYPEHPAASSNLGFIGLTFGAVVAPRLADWLTHRFGVKLALPLLALLGLIPAVLAIFTPAGNFPNVSGDGAIQSLFGNLHWWLLAAAVVCYQAIHCSLPGWSGTILSDLGWLPQRGGIQLFTNPGLWFIAGQAAAVYWLPPGGEAATIVLLAVCLAILLGNTLGNDRPLSGVIGLIVAFACIGPLLPTILGLAVQRYPGSQAIVISLLLAVNALTETLFAPMAWVGTGPKRGRGPMRWCLGGILMLAAVALALTLMR